MTNKSDFASSIVELLGVILLLFVPAAGYFDGWITGHLCNWVCGGIIVNGINTVFSTDFVRSQLPTIFGTLCMIGSFFYPLSLRKNGGK